MSTQIQRRRGTTAEHSTFTGVEGELTVDTTKDTAVVHDGTTVGGHPLQKQYPPLGSAAAPTYTFTGDTNTGIYSPGADQVAVATNGVGRLFVNASGDVGVGTSNPDNAFHIYAGNAGSVTANTVAQLTVENSGDAGINLLCPSAQDGWLMFGDPDDNFVGGLRYNHPSDFMALYSNNAERLRITSAGLVGIGTSSPGSTLHIEAAGNTVNQRIFTSDNVSNATASLTFGTTPGSRSKAAIQMVNSNTGNAAGDLALLTNNGSGLQNRLYITDTGRVGIGTTSPVTKLDITGANEEELLRLSTGNTPGDTFAQIRGDNESGIRIKGGGSYEGGTIELGGGLRNTDPGIIKFSTGTSSGTSTEHARIDSSGRLLVGTSSSSRLVTQILQGNSTSSTTQAVLFLGRGAASPTINQSLGVY
jgi:hypothetical protein